MSGTILLVEDNRQLNEINRRALEQAGYRVLAALTLAGARAHLAQTQPDVILLDVMLPDGDGVAFCGEIRNATDAHILFLTSKTGDEEHLRGLGAGGDDYIAKPYRMELMLARVAAALRRREMQRNAPRPGGMQRGRLRLDTISGRAYWDGEDLQLTQKQFALLLLLGDAPGRVVPKEQLYEKVWGQPMTEDAGALFTQTSRLKKRLEQASGGTATLFSSRGEGYSLLLE